MVEFLCNQRDNDMRLYENDSVYTTEADSWYICKANRHRVEY